MSGFDLPPVNGYERFLERPSLGGTPDGVRELRPLAPEIEDGPSSIESGFADALGALRSLQNDVDSKYKGLVMGEGVELHDVMLAANKSEVTFNLMLEVRNKLVEAWEKLSRSAV
ncbi:MAG: flagellar hook-basal body complex protein FliE [Planctomycetes bacterium]|nr:flagellar hook-basal body complex protein FliE [Planctomycetota bacterium]